MAAAPFVPAAASRLAITSVKAAVFPLLPAARFGRRNFSGDFDPARMRWFGAFSQLAGSILVEIRTDQGVTGYGLGGGGGAAVHIIGNHLSDLLVGANALNVELLWDQMFSSTSFYGRKGLALMAMSGIDLALWDIAGKAANLPVYQLLGGAKKARVRAYQTGNNVEAGLKRGFSAFKLSVDQGPPEGTSGKNAVAQQVSSARRAAGPDALLMIDCLARWDVEYTLEMVERMAADRLYWIEEPLLPDDLGGYERLCRQVRSTRIASGEHEYSHFGFQELLRRKAAHILQPDLTWCGGLTVAKRVAPLAAAAGVPLVPHRGGNLYGMHMIMADSNCPLAESFGTGEAGNELMNLFTAPYENGHYLLPPGPGFGLSMTEALLRKHAPALL